MTGDFCSGAAAFLASWKGGGLRPSPLVSGHGSFSFKNRTLVHINFFLTCILLDPNLKSECPLAKCPVIIIKKEGFRFMISRMTYLLTCVSPSFDVK